MQNQVTAPFALSVRSGSPAEVVVAVEGELDVSNAPRLRRALSDVIDGEPGSVVVDLSRLTFVDSTGLGVLVGADKRARALGVGLVLSSPQPSIAKVFEIAGVHRVMRVVA